MENLWNEKVAKSLKGNLLKLRVYSSRLLGQESDLVLHGGGNTSVKISKKNLFNEEEDILYVKGSGWDLGTIEAEGFAPVKLEILKKMAKLKNLSDTDMVKYQRAAMTNPSAPTPSIEAILHAIIPFTFVDHTHADAVVTISNTPDGKKRIKELYGNKVLIIPYVMPGFMLAKTIYDLTNNLDWTKIEGMILLKHGVFTFDDNPKLAYNKMIKIVTKAENYLKKEGMKPLKTKIKPGKVDTLQIASIRKTVSELRGISVLAKLNNTQKNLAYSILPNMKKFATRGPITPDHSIRTKCIPAILSTNPNKDIIAFGKDYEAYFNKFNDGSLTCLDKAPRWAVWQGNGTLSFGENVKNVQIIEDISNHTIKAVYQGEQLGGWKPLGQKDLFDMEYWTLEQAKLKKANNALAMQAKIAIVTGAASGIGKACVEKLVSEGAVVVALDINPSIKTCFKQKEVLGIKCDVTKVKDLNNAIQQTVLTFGGLDYLISNAGIFPKSMRLDSMEQAVWDKSLKINLSSHQELLHLCLPYLKLGIDPAVIFIASKNVPAPGPGAAAYSVAKAGLTQLARVAALELGKHGIRVNVVHPNAVYDTAIWTKEVLNTRAKSYGLSVDEYKTNNVLKTEVNSKDVAQLAVTMLGNTFSKITGAQIAIDGGNERII